MGIGKGELNSSLDIMKLTSKGHCSCDPYVKISISIKRNIASEAFRAIAKTYFETIDDYYFFNYDKLSKDVDDQLQQLTIRANIMR